MHCFCVASAASITCPPGWGKPSLSHFRPAHQRLESRLLVCPFISTRGCDVLIRFRYVWVTWTSALETVGAGAVLLQTRKATSGETCLCGCSFLGSRLTESGHLYPSRSGRGGAVSSVPISLMRQSDLQRSTPTIGGASP
jgi:hypothetical protein